MNWQKRPIYVRYYPVITSLQRLPFMCSESNDEIYNAFELMLTSKFCLILDSIHPQVVNLYFSAALKEWNWIYFMLISEFRFMVLPFFVSFKFSVQIVAIFVFFQVFFFSYKIDVRLLYLGPKVEHLKSKLGDSLPETS